MLRGKTGNWCDDSARFGGQKAKSKQNYEDGIAKVFHRSCESLGNKGRMLVVFANKDFDAWETLIGGLIRGGAVVTASWPIKTEMPNRARSLASSALSSSVWIVSRKREDSAQFGWDVIVSERMREILFGPRAALGNRNILQYYFDLGIRGPDFIWAALGPALQAYSEHPFVKKTEGGIMTCSNSKCRFANWCCNLHWVSYRGSMNCNLRHKDAAKPWN